MPMVRGPFIYVTALDLSNAMAHPGEEHPERGQVLWGYRKLNKNLSHVPAKTCVLKRKKKRAYLCSSPIDEASVVGAEAQLFSTLPAPRLQKATPPYNPTHPFCQPQSLHRLVSWRHRPVVEGKGAACHHSEEGRHCFVLAKTYSNEGAGALCYVPY